MIVKFEFQEEKFAKEHASLYEQTSTERRSLTRTPTIKNYSKNNFTFSSCFTFLTLFVLYVSIFIFIFILCLNLIS